MRNVTVNGKKHLVVLRRKVVEAEKALLVAKVNFNEASQALAFGIDVGMSPMQMARAEYNKAKADLAKLRKNRRVIDRKILAAKEKAKEYTDTVLQTMSSIMEGDVALNGAAAENLKLGAVYKMSHGKMIEAQRTAAESKAKLQEMDVEEEARRGPRGDEVEAWWLHEEPRGCPRQAASCQGHRVAGERSCCACKTR